MATSNFWMVYLPASRHSHRTSASRQEFDFRFKILSSCATTIGCLDAKQKALPPLQRSIVLPRKRTASKRLNLAKCCADHLYPLVATMDGKHKVAIKKVAKKSFLNRWEDGKRRNLGAERKTIDGKAIATKEAAAVGGNPTAHPTGQSQRRASLALFLHRQSRCHSAHLHQNPPLPLSPLMLHRLHQHQAKFLKTRFATKQHNCCRSICKLTTQMRLNYAFKTYT
mmetsp:Transcript_10318/g.15550  ORF Transcript_10318/g.15550 Transcript_10318/m.15550 type:complete len:225 (+) Transcript_10318:222-896(+)